MPDQPDSAKKAGSQCGCFDFSEEMESTDWLEALPKGLVAPKIDLDFHQVTIEKTQGGYQIYVGPREPEAGGDAVLVRLNNKLQLVDYEIERLEPLPGAPPDI